MNTTTQLIVLGAMLVLSGFFSGSETALTSVSDLKVRNLVKSNVKGAKTLAKLKSNMRRLIVTILIGNNIVNIGAASFATVLATNYFGSSGVGIATGAMTLLVLIFGEITPKSICNAHAERISLWLAPIILFLEYLMYPLVLIFEFITKIVMTLIGAESSSKLITEEEFKSMIEIGAEERVIKRKEKELIEGVLDFKDITAEEVMTPRTQMKVLAAKQTLKEALPKIVKSPHTRIPLISGSKDTVQGILYTKDVLKYLSENKKSATLKKISHYPLFTPENMPISDIFEMFQKKHVHIAIVVDEYGGTAGLVTMEDLLEEIVGEIIDESDITPDTIMRMNKKTIIAHGDTEVKLINHFFNTSLPDPNRTISALLIKKARSIPKKEKRIKLSSTITAIVEEKSKKRVLKVRLIKR